MYTDYTDENIENEYYEENNKNDKEKIKKIVFFVIAFVVILILIIVLAKACSNKSGNGTGNNNDLAISVAINRENVSLEVGETFELFADVLSASTENAEVYWLSEDSSIVTVDNGVLTGVSEGETYVVANYMEGELVYSSKCKVIVTSKAVEVESIDIIQEKIVMKLNDTVLLQINVLPEDAKLTDLVFISDDSTIASVNKDGYINAISEGTTSIMVSTKDGSLTDSITIVVNKTGTLVVEPVSLNLIGLSDGLIVGGTSKVIYELKPDNVTNTNLTWYSTDPSVATVDNGVVTGVKAGKCTIVATTDNNISSKLEVTVESSDIPVSSVVINGDTSIEMKVGGTRLLKYSISPENATNKKVKFTTSNSDVVYVDSNGIIAAIGKGNAVVTITTEDGSKTAIVNILVTDSSTGTQTGSSSSGESSSSGSSSSGSSSSGSSSSGSSSSSSSSDSSSSNDDSSSSSSSSSTCSKDDIVKITHDGSSQGAIISSIQWANASPFSKAAVITITSVADCAKDGKFSYKIYRGTTSSNVSTLHASGTNLAKGTNIKIAASGYFNLKITVTTTSGDQITKDYYVIISMDSLKYSYKYYDAEANLAYINLSGNNLVSGSKVIRYCLSSTSCVPTTNNNFISSNTTSDIIIRNVTKGQKICMAIFENGVRITETKCTSATTAPVISVTRSVDSTSGKHVLKASLTSFGSGSAKIYYCVNKNSQECTVTTSSYQITSGDTRAWVAGSSATYKYVCFQAFDSQGNKSIKKCYDLVNKKFV